MITAPDDGVLRTHDDAAALLRAAAPGATVRVLRIRGEGDKVRRYEVCLDRVGRAPVHQTATYGLPCPAEPLRAHVARLLAPEAPWMQ